MKLVHQNCEIIFTKCLFDKLAKSGNDPMLEHSTVYLKTRNYGDSMNDYDKINIEYKYIKNPYSKVIYGNYPSHYKSWEEKQKVYQDVYITTNLKVLTENGWLDDLEYICKPTTYHEKRVTVKFICSTLTSHNLINRDMICTENVDYDNELTFIIPHWLDIPEDTYELGKLRSVDNPEETVMVEISENNGAYNVESTEGKFLHVLDYASDRYKELINDGIDSQKAKSILPSSLKTELIMTGFVSDWKKFIDAKSKDPDPQIKDMIVLLKEEFAYHDILY